MTVNHKKIQKKGQSPKISAYLSTTIFILVYSLSIDKYNNDNLKPQI